MAKAIFKAPFNYTARRSNAGWAIKAGPKAQTFPQEVIDAAVAAGVARKVAPRRRAAKRPAAKGAVGEAKGNRS